MPLDNKIPKQIPLNELERFFKELYYRYPEQNPDIPHFYEQFRAFLKQVEKKASHSLPKALLNDNSLNILGEDLFFHSGFDTELYRHLRYLPANLHSHSFIEISCVMEGTCVNYILNQPLQMQRGDICIIAPKTEHAVSAFSDDCFMINIILRTSTFEKAFFGVLADNDILSDFFMQSLYNSNGHPYLLFHTREDPEIRTLLISAYDEFQENRRYKARFLNTIVNAFFLTLLRNHETDVVVSEVGTLGRSENMIYILRYMQEHYCTVTLKELSEFFNYSERQIQRLIKSSTGMNFTENIQELKMREAVRLLKDSDSSVTSIAMRLGYTNLSNFRNIFKRFYGMTPIEYREQ